MQTSMRVRLPMRVRMPRLRVRMRRLGVARWLALVLGAAALAPGLAAADSGELLYATEGNRLRRFDVDTIGGARLVDEVLIERASAGEFSGASGGLTRASAGSVRAEAHGPSASLSTRRSLPAWSAPSKPCAAL